MQKIKLFICDDIPELCRIYADKFKDFERLDFIGSANNSIDCLKMVKQYKPDVCLLDIEIEKMDSGINLIEPLLETNPNMKIIMLTIHDDDMYIFKALTKGAIDYIIKTEPIEDIVSKIVNTFDTPGQLSYDVAHKLLHECNKIKDDHDQIADKYNSLLYMFTVISKLSTSEFGILRELYHGKKYKDIALERYVEPSTVRAQATSILKKFGYKKMDKLLQHLKSTSIIEEFF